MCHAQPVRGTGEHDTGASESVAEDAELFESVIRDAESRLAIFGSEGRASSAQSLLHPKRGQAYGGVSADSSPSTLPFHE
jgi:hypothetical protein